jgi:hypothetical protein
MRRSGKCGLSFRLAFSLAVLLAGTTPMQQHVPIIFLSLLQGSATATLNDLSTGHFNLT